MTNYKKLDDQTLLALLLSPKSMQKLSIAQSTTPGQKLSRQSIIRMVEENGGPDGLDLSSYDLSGINLSKLDLHGIIFGSIEPLKFSDADRITGRTNIEGTWFERSDLRKANFGRANLKNASFYQANLTEATFWAADVEGASFRRSNLTDASFYASFLKDANFSDASMQGVNLQSATLTGIQISAKALNNTIIQEHFEAYHRNFHLWYTTDIIRKNYMSRHLNSRYGEAKEIYLSLKNAFLVSGRYEDASWAYYKERQMERKTFEPLQARKHYGYELQGGSNYWIDAKFFAKYTIKWTKSFMVDLSIGYGERPSRVIVLSLVIILSFAFLYWASNSIYSTSSQDVRWIDYLNYSIATFSTIGFSDLVPRGDIAKILTSIQALLGISSLALLMYALGRKIGGS